MWLQCESGHSNRILVHSYRSSFNYDPQIDYAHKNSIQTGAMNKIDNKCFAKKMDKTNSMCCASGKVIVPNIEVTRTKKKNFDK